jgi:hypothetical protein
MPKQMASKYELQYQIREALRGLVPKAIGQMKTHELQHTLAALKHKGEIKTTISEFPSAAGTALPRPIPTKEEGDIKVPMLPKERVLATSSAAEKKAFRESMGMEKAPHFSLGSVHTKGHRPPTIPKNPKGVVPPGLAAYQAKRKAEKEAALLAAASAPAPPKKASAPKPKKPITPPPSVEEDDIDPKAVRIVRAHAAEKKPIGRPPKKATAAKPAGGAGTDSDAMMTAFQEFLKQRETAKVEDEDE